MKSQDQVPDTPKMERFENNIDIGNIQQLQRTVGLVADSSFRNGYISKESFSFLNGISGDPKIDETLEAMSKSSYAPPGGKDGVMKDILKHATDHYQKAQIIDKYLTDAINSKFATKDDRQFLLENIVHKPEFVGQFSEVNNLIKGKLERMKNDKNEFDQLVNHSLVRNVGFLKINANTKLAVPNEKDFLKMTVPERRAFLKKAKEALPKAEEYADKIDESESKELTKEYKELLNKALKNKVIGSTTYKKFLDGFSKVDKDDKEVWVKEFDSQMERYQTLWSNIRTTLQCTALEHMESQINKKGYTELFVEFKKVSEKEKIRLDAGYKSDLNKFKEMGYIGDHTINEYNTWMNSQDLKRKYEARNQMHDKEGGQMERYKNLTNKIKNNLKPKAAAYIESKKDKWGYTEIKSQYDKFMAGKKVPTNSGSVNKKTDPLSVISSNTTRSAIVEANLKLKKRGAGKRDTFLMRLTKMFVNEKQDSYDAGGFQSNLRKNREAVNNQIEKKVKRDSKKGDVDAIDFQEKFRRTRSKSRSESLVEDQFPQYNIPSLAEYKNQHLHIQKKDVKRNEPISREGVNNEMKILETENNAHIVDENGFRQVEVSNNGHTERKAQVEINRNEAMDRFFVEDNKHQYKSKTEGGMDDLSLAINTQDGRSVELNLTDIRAMKKYMEEDKRAEQSGGVLDEEA